MTENTPETRDGVGDTPSNNAQPIIDTAHFDGAVETSVDDTANDFGRVQRSKMEKSLRVVAAQVNADFDRFLKSLNTNYSFGKGEEDAEILVLKDYLNNNEDAQQLKSAEAEIDERIAKLEEEREAASQAPEEEENDEEKTEREERVKKIEEEIQDAQEIKELVNTALVESGIRGLEDRIRELEQIIKEKDDAVKPQDPVELAIRNLEDRKARLEEEKAKKADEVEANGEEEK